MALKRGIAVLLCAAAVMTAGARCDRGPRPTPAHELDWLRVALPKPAGANGRIAVRDSAACGGRWYIVGATIAADGAIQPAAWTSRNGTSWTAMTLTPRSFYGRQNLLYAAACWHGWLAAIGAKSGGAHGNPRVSTWFQRIDGSLDEAIADPLRAFGGPNALSVARVAGGPAGWLIIGSRASGAASWVSADASEFEIIEGAPELAGDSRGVTLGADVIAYGTGWLAVGSLLAKGGTDTEPVAWTSPDGRGWRRLAVPGGPSFDDLQRATVVGDAVLAVGIRGDTFGAWRGAGDGTWTTDGRFGRTGGSVAAGVDGLARFDGGILAATHSTEGRRLWWSDGNTMGWSAVNVPVSASAEGDTAMTVAAAEGTVLLLVDDGRSASAWVANVDQ